MRITIFILPWLVVACSFFGAAQAADPLAPHSVIGVPQNQMLVDHARGRANLVGRRAIDDGPAILCETAVHTAEYVNRLPARLLEAISLTETGRADPVSSRIRPWPWTINAEGEGLFFNTKAQAIDAVRALQQRGVQSIDVGCLQVNLMFHPNAFASLDDAFDPRSNANYAARFINALRASGKDLMQAIGAYHSETPRLGDAYRTLVLARWQNAERHDKPAVGSAYREVSSTSVYADFVPRTRVYGAFAPR